MRLTSTSYVVLSLLNLLGEATPYDLKQTLEFSTENFWPVPHTTFYAEPTRLAGGGYLSEVQESSGRKRKLYSLTALGKEALSQWTGTPGGGAPPQLRDEAMLKIFAGSEPLALFAERRDWHKAKLDELEHCLAILTDATTGTSAAALWSGPRTTLFAGIAYHGKQIEAYEELLVDPRVLQEPGQGPGPGPAQEPGLSAVASSPVSSLEPSLAGS